MVRTQHGRPYGRYKRASTGDDHILIPVNYIDGLRGMVDTGFGSTQIRLVSTLLGFPKNEGGLEFEELEDRCKKLMICMEQVKSVPVSFTTFRGDGLMAFLLKLLVLLLSMMNEKKEAGGLEVEATGVRDMVKWALEFAAKVVVYTASTVDDTLVAIGIHLVSDDALWELVEKLAVVKATYGGQGNLVEEVDLEEQLRDRLTSLTSTGKFGAFDFTKIMELVAVIIALINKRKPVVVDKPVIVE